MKDDAAPISVVIVAAGRGTRAGGEDGPKQYQSLAGESVLWRAMLPFLGRREIERVVVVIHGDDVALYERCTRQNSKLLEPAIGGATRQLSVLSGLEALAPHRPQKVLIHDAARPFVSQAVLDAVINGLDRAKAALPSVAIADTLKRADYGGNVGETISRDNMFAAQTPQGFHFQAILDAHQKAHHEGRDDFTDDSALAEWAGINVLIVEGDPQNTKITSKEDIKKAKERFSQSIPDIRVGHGYDTHRLVDGDHVWLCGVKLPHSHSLSGHSDADIGLHSLTDALLSTVAAGDIGHHFPPSDDEWKDARSDQFLKHAAQLVTSAGGRITHMDVTLVCETPKIGPHRDAMRQTIADISGVEVDRISVKATTNEKIGFIGRNEGMVALATATVVMGAL